jgi:hypothetical protein
MNDSQHTKETEDHDNVEDGLQVGLRQTSGIDGLESA